MAMRFYKYQVAGNDFIVIDCDSGLCEDEFRNLAWPKLACRRRGIGGDQIIYIADCEVSKRRKVVFLNADGSESGQCLNGMLAVAWHCLRHGLVVAGNLSLYTFAVAVTVKIAEKFARVALAPPTIWREDDDVFSQLGVTTSYASWLASFSENSSVISCDLVALGNLHLVVRVANFTPELEREIVARVHASLVFEDGINLSLVWLGGRNEINIRTHERGSGLTWACGSASVAAGYSLAKRGVVNNSSIIKSVGGQVVVDVGEEVVELTGNPVYVYQGNLKVEY